MADELKPWKTIDSIPKDGDEILVCNTRQGGVKQLVSWDNVHRYWVSKGVPDLSFQWTHWMAVPKSPKRTP